MKTQAGRVNLKTQDMLIIVISSFVIGFAISMAIFTSDAFDELGETVEAIQEVAQIRDVEQLDFYRISYVDLETWLDNVELDMDDDLMANLATVGEINTSTDLILYFDDQTEAVDNVLATVFMALNQQAFGLEATAEAEPTADSDGEEAEQLFMVCLAVDSDPYSATGPGLYVYVEVPEELSDEMPKESEGWEELADPKELSMTWAAECYDPAADAEDSATDS
jgi:hypothetical protein